MKKKVNEPPVPHEMHDTIRHGLVTALTEGPLSAKELSGAIGIPEKEVYDHLEHIRKSIVSTGRHLVVTPAECRKCGFEFSKRERLKKPSKCPVCRGESIHDPLFAIEEDP